MNVPAVLPPTKSYRRVAEDLLAEYDRSSAQDGAYWDEHWREEDIEPKLKRAAGGHLGGMERLLDGLTPGGRILEGGCGIGQLVAALNARGFRAEGLDFAEETLAKSKKILPDLPLRSGDLRELSYEDDSFDGYISVGVIEHFTNPDDVAAILGEARRVTTGSAFISVPHLSPGLASREASGQLPVADGDANFYQYYMTPGKLRNVLESHGWRVEKTVPYATLIGLRRHHPVYRNLGRTRLGRATLRKLQKPIENYYADHWSHMLGAWAVRA